MGCAWLALDLVRNWTFAPPVPSPVPGKEEVAVDTKGASRGGRQSRRQSGVKSPTMATTTSPREERAKPTMFKEPEASSLLDNFGF